MTIHGTGRDEAATRAEREAAVADAEARRRASRESMERDQSRQQLTGIYDRLRRAEEFRNHVVATSRRAAVQQNRQALIADVEKDIAALNPTPAPEPTIVVVQEDDGSADFGGRNFDDAKWSKKPRSWF